MANPANTLARTTQDKRIPELDTLPPGTNPSTLTVPVYDPATDKTHQAPLGGPVPNTNAVPGGAKVVQYRDSRLYGVPAGALTLDRLDLLTIAPGTLATVDNPADTPLTVTKPPQQYVATVVAAGTAGAVVVPRYIGAPAGDVVSIRWEEEVVTWRPVDPLEVPTSAQGVVGLGLREAIVWLANHLGQGTVIPTPTPAPTITGFLPISGARGSTVVLTGTDFTGATVVSINNGAVASFTVDSATQITAVLSSAQATGKVRVTTPAGTGVSANDFTVVVGAPIVLGPNDVALIGMTGQSNELSNADQAAFAYSPLDTIGGDVNQVFANVYMYRAANNTLEHLQEGVNTRMAEDNSIPQPYSFHTSDAGVWQVGNGAASYTFQAVTRCYFLAKKFKETYPNGTLVIVQGAVGGVPRSRWVKANNDLYTRFVNQVTSAKALITAQSKTVRMLGISCTQGEQDSTQGTSTATYDTQMRSMWSDLLADVGTSETQLIEFGIPDDGSTGTYIANPFNGLKASWAAEDARRHYFGPETVVLEEDRIHFAATSQMEEAAKTIAVVFNQPYTFPVALAQAGPTLAYDATTQIVTITPPSPAWQKREFYYQIGAYTPVQLINNWTVKLTASAPIGGFKCWARAVPGRAKSAVTTNAVAWAVPSTGRQPIASGYAVWLPERGNVISPGVYGTTLTGRTLSHNSAAPNGWTNFAPASARLAIVPSTFTGIALQIDIPAITKEHSAVTIGGYAAANFPPTTNENVFGFYMDNGEYHLQLGGGVKNGAIVYSSSSVPVSIVLNVATAGQNADLYLADVNGNPLGNVFHNSISLAAAINLVTFLYGNPGWDTGQDVSQVTDVYLHSDYLETAFI